MPRERKYDDSYFTKEELAEIEMLNNSPEVKAAREEAARRARVRSRLYNLRALYKQGKDILSKECEGD